MIGERIAGRYRLVAQIGEGATGTVYRATIEPDGDGAGDGAGVARPEAVAVKILRADLAPPPAGSGGGDEAARGVEREAIAAGKLEHLEHLEHPNLVAVRDLGALDDGRPYLVMDLVDGRSLADIVADQQPLPEARALAILVQVLRGLRHAHDSGVVHRDLKPADILLVERDGQPEVAVIVDLGSAALLGAGGAAAERLTRAGAARGAPAYMAPERLDPEHGPIDGRADLYSATCILFEMLTGKPPFGAFDAVGAVDPVDLLARHRSAPRPALSDQGVKSSPGLDAIVARGLAIDPADRFATAADYLEAVEAYREGRVDPAAIGEPAGVAGPAGPRPEGGARSPRRLRYIVLGGAGLAVIVAVALAVGGAVGERSREKASADRAAQIVEAWRAAGLEPGPLQRVASERFGGGECQQGKVSGIEVALCRHPTDDAAKAAAPVARDSMEGGPSAAYPSGQFLLVARVPSRRGPDPAMRKLTMAFRRTAKQPAKKRPR
jgi:hypothetical protein